VRVTLPASGDSPEKAGLLTVHERLTIAVFQIGAALYAIDNRCPHRGAPLAQGLLADANGPVIICPLHHFKFYLETGRCLLPRHLWVRTFPVSREGCDLVVEVPDEGTK
jgi:nitrite reductase/ring-hydroxylating ferredoxin subunit